MDALIILNDNFRFYRRTVSFSTREGLCIVRFVTVHPGRDYRIILVFEGETVLRTDHRHPGLLQGGELIRIGTSPERNIKINSSSFVLFGVFGVLQPDCNWKIAGIRWVSYPRSEIGLGAVRKGRP